MLTHEQNVIESTTIIKQFNKYLNEMDYTGFLKIGEYYLAKECTENGT